MNNWLASVSDYSDLIITWLAPLALLLLALLVAMPDIKRLLLEWQLKRCIRRLGYDSLHHVVIPDGVDGVVYLEHLVLGKQTIYVLPIQRYRGVVFAADNIDTWTQVNGNRSYKFTNPLHQLEADILAVKSNLPKAAIDGRVLVTRGAEFPKGKPDKVVSMSEIESMLGVDKQTEPVDEIKQAWNSLKKLVASESMRELKSQFTVSDNGDNNKSLWLALLFVLSGLGWLTWRLFFA